MLLAIIHTSNRTTETVHENTAVAADLLAGQSSSCSRADNNYAVKQIQWSGTGIFGPIFLF